MYYWPLYFSPRGKFRLFLRCTFSQYISLSASMQAASKSSQSDSKDPHTLHDAEQLHMQWTGNEESYYFWLNYLNCGSPCWRLTVLVIRLAAGCGSRLLIGLSFNIRLVSVCAFEKKSWIIEFAAEARGWSRYVLAWPKNHGYELQNTVVPRSVNSTVPSESQSSCLGYHVSWILETLLSNGLLHSLNY